MIGLGLGLAFAPIAKAGGIFGIHIGGDVGRALKKVEGGVQNVKDTVVKGTKDVIREGGKGIETARKLALVPLQLIGGGGGEATPDAPPAVEKVVVVTVGSPARPIVFDQANGQLSLDGQYVLQKDATIFADTVRINGQIITLGHKLTIICRKLIFANRTMSAHGDYGKHVRRAEFSNPWPHISSISGLRRPQAMAAELAVNPGAVTLIAASIEGQPIIHHSRSLYVSDDASQDRVSSVRIEYGESEIAEDEGLWDEIQVGARPEIAQALSVKRSLQAPYKFYRGIVRATQNLRQMVGLYESTKKPESLGLDDVETIQVRLKLSIQNQSRKIRDEIVNRDFEMLQFALSIDEKRAGEIYDLFVPDDIDIQKFHAAAQNDEFDGQLQFLQIDSPKKWNVDFAASFLNDYVSAHIGG